MQYTLEPTLTYNDIADVSNNMDDDSIQMKTQPTLITDSLGMKLLMTDLHHIDH